MFEIFWNLHFVGHPCIPCHFSPKRNSKSACTAKKSLYYSPFGGNNVLWVERVVRKKIQLLGHKSPAQTAYEEKNKHIKNVYCVCNKSFIIAMQHFCILKNVPARFTIIWTRTRTWTHYWNAMVLNKTLFGLCFTLPWSGCPSFKKSFDISTTATSKNSTCKVSAIKSKPRDRTPIYNIFSIFPVIMFCYLKSQKRSAVNILLKKQLEIHFFNTVYLLHWRHEFTQLNNSRQTPQQLFFFMNE